MAKPIEDNDNAKEFWENLSDATALADATQSALRAKIGAAPTIRTIVPVTIGGEQRPDTDFGKHLDLSVSVSSLYLPSGTAGDVGKSLSFSSAASTDVISGNFNEYYGFTVPGVRYEAIATSFSAGELLWKVSIDPTTLKSTGDQYPAGAFYHAGLVSGSAQTLESDDNFVTTLLMRQETQEVAKFLSSTPLVDWVTGDWSGAGALVSRGLKSNDLTFNGTPTITESNNGRQMNFDGTSHFGYATSADTWQRVNDGKPFVILVEGDDLFETVSFGALLATSSPYGVGNKGFYLASFTDYGGRFIFNITAANVGVVAMSIPNLTAKVVTGVSLAYDGTKVEFVVRTTTDIQYASSTSDFSAAAGATSANGVANELRFGKFLNANGDYLSASISRIRLWDRYIDPRKILSK